MNSRAFKLGLALLLASGSAQAAGPLYTYVDNGVVKPFLWDTSRGTVPVWTDGGGAFTYDVDGVTPFITIERANEITAFAVKQWSDVPTSTFSAAIAGTIESQTGIADVTGANATEMYGVERGYGLWVNYDTDGSILEEYFGVSRNSVLGIAFPEFADVNGHITEAKAVLNGWFVDVKDTNGDMVAGVFTHEFGHAINLSHSQVNGYIAYSSQSYAPIYQGVPGCGLTPYLRWSSPASTPNRADPAWIETMYPFIDTLTVRQGDGKNAGREQSTVDTADDVAGISNLYPTPEYLSSRGSITGVLRLKDGRTEYSGINVIARNVANPMVDAVSAMSGDQTQGQLGPDGRFTLRNLTPDAQYQVYIEEIVAGGYPTTPMRLLSEQEYWNAAEGTDPATDLACDATSITAEAGVTQTADIYLNGYQQGVQFTPIVEAFLTDLSKDGRKSAGVANTTAFLWDVDKGFTVLPSGLLANNGSMTRNGQKMLVNADLDGNGISSAVLWSQNGAVLDLGSLNGDTCGGSGSIGKSSSYGWAVDDSGKTAVGTAYVDTNGDGSCQSSFRGEILPFIWTPQQGMHSLDTSTMDLTKVQYIRAHAISGNGRVVLGQAGTSVPVAWVDDGKLIDLKALFGANLGSYASSFDGSKVPVQTVNGRNPGEVVLWNAVAKGPATSTGIGAPKWCKDVPYLQFGTNLCTIYDGDYIESQVGAPQVTLSDMNDDGSVLVARTGSFRTGFAGVLWIQDIGWMTWPEFFRKQGVVEASKVPFDNPMSISASGREVVGGIAGASFSWYVDIDQVFVCENGQSVQTGFPNGLRDKIAEGAQFGRCEFQ